jgi:hypothetical protein
VRNRFALFIVINLVMWIIVGEAIAAEFGGLVQCGFREVVESAP